MNVSKVLTKDYENDNAFRPHENKAKQTQFQSKKRLTVNRGIIILEGWFGFKKGKLYFGGLNYGKGKNASSGSRAAFVLPE